MRKLLFVLFSIVACSAEAAIAVTASLWITSPAYTDNTASGAFTLGSKFQTNVPGVITQLKFYKSASDTATSRNLILWSAGGTNLAQCTSSVEATGTAQWITCPVTYAVAPGQTYYVSYDVASGAHYATSNVSSCSASIEQAQAWLTVGGPCCACGAAAFYASSTSTFPTTANSSAAYFADVVLSPV